MVGERVQETRVQFFTLVQLPSSDPIKLHIQDSHIEMKIMYNETASPAIAKTSTSAWPFYQEGHSTPEIDYRRFNAPPYVYQKMSSLTMTFYLLRF